MLANSDIQRIYSQIKGNQSLSSPNKNVFERSSVFSKIRTINLIVFIIIATVICRIVYLNTFNTHFLTRELDSRIMRTIKVTAMRGSVMDRNNNPLAVSTPVASIWVDPTQLDNLTKEQIEKAANILGMTVTELNGKLNQKSKTFVYLKRAITLSQAEQIRKLNIDGVYSLQEFKRYYPYANLTAHVVGFNNIDDNGAEGIEYADNKNLIGHDGQEKIMRDRQGNVVQNIEKISPAQNGQDIALSIDNRIQSIAYNALKTQVEKFDAQGGAALVLDAKTGEVLAMVNMPSYNPNNRIGVNLDAIRNRAAIDVYEPGSIIKPLLISKGLDLGIIKPSTVFDTHQYYVGTKLIKDDHAYSSMTIAEIIQHSSDIGASKVALKLNKKDMWEYYNSIGFGRKLGTNFPGEATGIFHNWKKWYPIDQAEMGFGYGISVSLMQMARAYTIFTNKGCLLPVSFYKENSASGCQQVISAKTAEQMRGILADSTVDGTGKSAQTSDYTTAGKTGTAQKYNKVGGYTTKQYYGSFVGFAPALNPRLIIAVTVDNPRKGGYHGAATSGPVFAAIAEPSLHLLGIKPDKK
ncbi:MAG: penicillin-binding protein 2 [Proteobacteria bacterium]|jgi:cell division protein FtsI (penicillin-binding protein 3)|nr:penicillin-binding protein 2 [Pseudomonadota bacterium]